MDKHYRTLVSPVLRAISGHSMGGFGALSIAFKYPDVFGAVYSLSPGIFNETGLSECQLIRGETFISTVMAKRDDFSEQNSLAEYKNYIKDRYSRQDWNTPFLFAYGTAMAANPGAPFPHFDYPLKKQDGKLVRIDTIWKKYDQGYGGWNNRINSYLEKSISLRIIIFEVGKNDGYKWIVDGSRYLSSLLKKNKIHHEFIEFEGGHEDKVGQRFENQLLIRLSKELTY